VSPARGPLSFMRAKGVRVCLDDFGTGHSSITTLHSLPIDQIKLDRSLARGLVSRDGRRCGVRTPSMSP
jgi:EAL domain-containing protein (putative c-di-GMP-specific phosphodiesterase class I)